MQNQKTSPPHGGICESIRTTGTLNYDQNGLRLNVLPFPQHPGVSQVLALSEIHVGERAVLVNLELPEGVQNHLMHMGFVPDAQVTVLRRAPAGDPTVYAIDGMEVALRRETAAAIRVRALDEVAEDRNVAIGAAR